MAGKIAVHAEIRGSADVGGVAAHRSIKVVAELTGLPLGTLRAWERRYGFPKPTRRAGSNRRLYSAEQLPRLQLLARAVARGYRPSDVISMGEAELGGPPGEEPADVPALIEWLKRDDVKRIEEELRLAAAALGPRRFVTELAQPLARAVGEAWAGGRLAIRQEHMMTECLTTQLRVLLSAQQSVEGGPTIVLATLPGEPHTLSLQMVALYVALGAAKPRLLGPSTPPEQLIEAVRALGAQVVGIASMKTAPSAPLRRDVARLARGLPASVALWAGGRGARRLSEVCSRVEAVDSWPALDAALSRVQQ